MVQYYLRKSDL